MHLQAELAGRLVEMVPRAELAAAREEAAARGEDAEFLAQQVGEARGSVGAWVGVGGDGVAVELC